jgi:peptide/nickel transport system permease protein
MSDTAHRPALASDELAPLGPDLEPSLEVLDPGATGIVSAPRLPRGQGRAMTLLKVAGLVVSPFAIWFALAEMQSAPAGTEVAVVVAALVAAFFGVDAVAKRIWGPAFKTGTWLSAVWLLLVVVSAITADWLPLAESRDSSRTFQEPILASPDLFSSHPLGTDRQGLDILGGIIYGFRVSFTIGVGTVVIGVLLGGSIGVLAGYFRRAADTVVGFFTNSMLAFPPLILLLGVAAVMERNVRNLTLALALVTIPTYVRLARANTLVVSQREFVVAARSLGARSRHIIVRDIAPAVVRPLVSYAFVVVAVVVVAEASLSFLGLGIPRPEPTIGNLISAGQRDFERYPHLVFGPAIALFLSVLSLNRLGEEAQRRLSGRQSKL